jgi:phospholipid N-methyltransferase
MGDSAQLTGWAFLRGVLRAPRTVGAIAPSSRWLVRAMLDEAHIETASIVVEFGPGTGAFTQEIVPRMHPDARLIVFEIDALFAAGLQRRFPDPRVHVINASAAQSLAYLARLDALPADCIISGLPFASLPRPVTRAILHTTTVVLRPGGLFVTYQYTPLMRRVLRGYFPQSYIARLVLPNLPPALIFVCPNAP